MSSTPNTTSKKFWKSPKFWLAFTFLSYSAFGWFAVPYIVKDQMINTLNDIAAWDTKIESVVFNPYALSLAVTGFEAKDAYQQDAVSFDRLFVNVSALGSLSGKIAFDEISLHKPSIHAQLDSNGQSNFERDFIKENDKPEPKKEESSEPLTLFFGLISISDGHVYFADKRTDETYEVKLEPINLALHDFSTDENDGGDYSLKLSLGNNQELDWKGRIGIAPFSSTGSFSLSNLNSSSFWHYAKPYSPYALQNALISIEASYDTEFSDSVSRFILDNSAVSIQQIKLAESAESQAFFSLDSVNLSPIEFNLQERKAQLGMLEINTPEIYALKNEDSVINLLAPLQTENSAQGLPESTPDTDTNTEDSQSENSDTFLWSIAGIKLKEGKINWQDKSLESPADLSIEHINLALGKITHQLDKAFSYELKFNTGHALQQLSGNLAAAPFDIKGKLDLEAVPLTWLQPYVGEQLNIILEQGQFGLASEYQLSIAENGLSGEVSVDTSITELALQDKAENKALAGFQNFSISGLDVALKPQGTPSISVEEVKLSQPYAKAQKFENGEMNLAQISKSESEPESSDDDEAQEKIDAQGEETTASKPPANVAIKNIIIEEGRFDYIDASINPVFNTYVDQFSGTISNLSSDVDAHSQVALSGNLDSFGKIIIDGTSNPLSAQPNTALNIKVNNIDLTTASPYSAKFAGYLIDKGKLDLDLGYDINGSQLQANNHIFIDQFNFGDSVDSPDATSLPLPLAIGIMKNLDGEIDIDLPISGDLSDPAFSLGGVIFTAFTNVITKVVTSPFSVLGSLIEGSDDISSANFNASKADLSKQESDKLLKLAEALNKRPDLNLEIRGVADKAIDLAENNQAMSEKQLAILAKNRALHITKVLTSQGAIPKQRIFTLEPKVVNSAQNNSKPDTETSVPSVFTIKVD